MDGCGDAKRMRMRMRIREGSPSGDARMHAFSLKEERKKELGEEDRGSRISAAGCMGGWMMDAGG